MSDSERTWHGLLATDLDQNLRGLESRRPVARTRLCQPVFDLDAQRYEVIFVCGDDDSLQAMGLRRNEEISVLWRTPTRGFISPQFGSPLPVGALQIIPPECFDELFKETKLPPGIAAH